jgi:hypothetical protein
MALTAKGAGWVSSTNGAVGGDSAVTAGAGGFFLKKLNMGLGWVAGIEAGLEAAAIIAGCKAL